jgi:hypothetical protein
MKTRECFVSNSSSSSFIVAVNEKGVFQSETSDYVCATVGMGVVAVVKRKEDDYEFFDDFKDKTNTFSIVFGYEIHETAFIRPFSQMKPDQTLEQFKQETEVLFNELFAKQCKNIKKPEIIVAGDLGNG